MHQYARNSLSELFEVKALQEVLLPQGVVGKAKRKLIGEFRSPFCVFIWWVLDLHICI